MERQETVTRNELRELHVGQTRIFFLNKANKVASARVTCRQMGLEYGMEFDVRADYINMAVCVTRKR